MSNEQPVVHCETRGHVYIMRLGRAEKYNAFSLQMLRELAAAFTTWEQDPDLRCGVLLAEGDHFTAGLQLDEVGPAVRSGQRLFPEDHVDPLDLYQPRRSKPLICAVQGWCLTIGIELLLASDIRLAAEGTRFSQLEIKRGIMPFGGATLRFPQVCGWGNAMRWLLTGDEFGPDEAQRIGLVQEVCSAESLAQRAIELAEVVAAQAPLGVQGTLASSRLAVEQGQAAALEGLIDQARALMDSEDAAEGLASFVERRPAVFKGR